MQEDQKEVKKQSRLRTILWVGLIALIFLPLFLSILLQFEGVQNWVGNRVTSSLSNKLGTEVSVKRFNFKFTKGVVLEDFYIQNNEKDTLLYIGEASTDLLQNLSSLFNNRLSLDKISIRDVLVQIDQSRGDSLSNFQRYISLLSSKDKESTTSSNDFALGINEIKLENLRFLKENQNTGSGLNLMVEEGVMRIDTLNFLRNHFAFHEINFTNPLIKISNNSNDDVFFETKKELQDSVLTNNESLIEIDVFCLNGGQFIYNDNTVPAQQRSINAMDYAHLNFDNLQVNSENFKLINNNKCLARINEIRFTEENGFELENLEIADFYIDDQKAELEGFLLRTNKSRISKSLSFTYDGFESFSDIINKVRLNLDFNNTELSIYDLNYFFPDLYEIDFFKKNYNRVFKLNGKIRGTVNRLSASNLKLSIDELLNYSGRFSLRNLSDIENATVSFKIDELRSSIPKLRKVLPDFNPPENFNLLGDIVYTGRFNGSIFDFVSFGSLNSDLGLVDMDLRMDLKKGVENAAYSGLLNLVDFDLRTWSGNEEFDRISIEAEIKNGKGLRLDNAFADLSAKLTDFSFKEYTYEDLNFDGKIDRSNFNGQFQIEDENARLNFDGNLDFNDEVIIADFKSSIDKFDLHALNLSKEDIEIHGDFDIAIVGTGINDFVGDAFIKNMVVLKDEKPFEFDSLTLSSSPLEKEGRLVELKSHFLESSLEGVFNLEDLSDHFKNYFHQFYPGWAARLKLPKPKSIQNDQDFKLSLSITDSKDYFELINLGKLRLVDTKLETNANFSKDIIISNFQSGVLSFDNLSVKNVDLYLDNETQFGNYRFQSDSLQIGSKVLNPIEIVTRLEQDSARIEINTFGLLDSFERVELVADLIPTNRGFEMKFSQKNWEMLGSDWSFNPRNNVVLGENNIYIEHFNLTDGSRSVRLEDINNKGIRLDLKGFDFLIVNELINYDKIDFGGIGDLSLINDNIFDNGNIELDYTIPEFTLNGDSYGMLKLLASSIEKDILGTVLRIYRSSDGQDIKLEGVYNMKTKDIDAELVASKFDLRLFEYIIDDGISDTQGTAEVDARLNGSLDDPKLFGEAVLNDGGTQINYLGNFVSFDKQKITITETYVDLNGLEIKDRLGNIGRFSGGLNHYFLGDFTIDLSIDSDNFLALDTDKSENPLYYGQGIGQINLNISGDFGSPNFIVNATTGPGAELNIPIESSESDFDESFIKFVSRGNINKLSKKEEAQALEIEGVNFDMNLTVTPDALFNIIFDERLNDIIKGRGRGDMQIQINRRGDFEVYGDYEVESGEYLFTAWGIVAKPFTVKRGGTITWTGDPFNATLNIEAFYEDLKAPVNVFLAEYLLAETQAAQEAKSRTDIDLTMKITGFLYTPTVQFDMFFPELIGELKSYSDSKMRTLRQNESELNDQVAGLILFGTFLPTNNALGNSLVSTSSIISGGYYTLSEMIGNQLSFLLSGILDEAFTENGLITGIDFDIGFNKNTQVVEGELSNTGFIPDEVEVHLRPKFTNDRWGIDVGTNYIRQSAGTGAIENYVVNDFIIEYFLTKDRRLKLRAYAKNDYDVFIAQREQIFGVGLNYRKEFGSLSDLTKTLKEDIQQDIEDLDNQQFR